MQVVVGQYSASTSTLFLPKVPVWKEMLYFVLLVLLMDLALLQLTKLLIVLFVSGVLKHKGSRK